MVVRLNIKDNSSKVRTVELLENSELILGRSEASDIVLGGMTVSRRHAILSLKDGECFLEDIGSTAGTWLNGERISGKVRIKPSDKFNIGSFELYISAFSKGAMRGAGASQPPSDSAAKMPLYDVQTSTEMYSDDMLELARQIQSRVLEILNIGGGLQQARFRPTRCAQKSKTPSTRSSGNCAIKFPPQSSLKNLGLY